jgi:hypothetical protein
MPRSLASLPIRHFVDALRELLGLDPIYVDTYAGPAIAAAQKAKRQGSLTPAVPPPTEETVQS